MSRQTTDELFAQITNRLIAQIEAGAGKWEKPWTTLIGEGGLAVNAKTKRAYQGFNQLVLMFTAMDAGYEVSEWATYKQWQELGGQVKKGEKGIVLVKWGKTYYCQEEGCGYKGRAACGKDDHYSRAAMWASPFTVFNIAQQEGVELPEKADKLPEPERLALAEQVIEQSGAEIRFVAQDRAYYQPVADTITLPKREQFKTPQGFYGTAFHELGHWTGHESRLGREIGKSFGDEKYAAEELVAELTATFVSVAVGVTVEPHIEHASYLDSWLKALKAAPKNLYLAARDAQRAANFLLRKAGVQVASMDEQIAA